MVGVLLRGDDPGHRGQSAVAGDIREDLRLRRDDVTVPVSAVADGTVCVVGGPQVAAVVADDGAVVLPRLVRRVEARRERIVIEARERPLRRAAARKTDPRIRSLGCIATPRHAVGRVDDVVVRRLARLRRDQELMRREAVGRVGLKHVIAEREALRHGPVRLDLGARDVRVREVLRQTFADEVLQVEAVHLAAVVLGVEVAAHVAEVAGALERVRLQCDVLARVREAARRCVGAVIAAEQVGERTVLLHDDDDVLDLTAIRRLGRRARQGRRRRRWRDLTRRWPHGRLAGRRR